MNIICWESFHQLSLEITRYSSDFYITICFILNKLERKLEKTREKIRKDSAKYLFM